jgi:branched-chain amino acid transport system substrate-binding protein
VGQAGNNGVVLAVEQINRAGGIRGRQVELISRDDAQNPATAEKSARELAAAKVDAVIGPFTSGVAAAVVPVLAQSQTLAISPTLTSMAFYGKDDNLVRINRTHPRQRRRLRAGAVRPGPAPDCRRLRCAQPQLHRVVARGVPSRLHRHRRHGGAEVPYESSPDVDFGAVVARC